MFQIHKERLRLLVSEWLYRKNGDRKGEKEGDMERKRDQEEKHLYYILLCA